MAYEMVMPYHLHMPSYFLETFTEYPFVSRLQHQSVQHLDIKPYCFLNFRNHDIFISRM